MTSDVVSFRGLSPEDQERNAALVEAFARTLEKAAQNGQQVNAALWVLISDDGVASHGWSGKHFVLPFEALNGIAIHALTRWNAK